MTSTSASSSASPTGWTGPQCVKDANTRALTSESTALHRTLYNETSLPDRLDTTSNNPTMTIELCQSLCKAQSYTYCGIEYGGECYGDNTIHTDAPSGAGSVISNTNCNVACHGTPSLPFRVSLD